jgi:ElaB/YqjD/DUF883 family membrane-anchored ribosome-binding protein
MEKTMNNMSDSMKSTSKQAANMASEARGALMDKAAPAMDYLKENFEAVRNQTEPYLTDARATIKRFPFYTVAGAVAVGTLFGILIGRSRSSDLARKV